MLGKKERRRNLTMTILSLSLLTVMAGAAVAPALDTIRSYFSDVDPALVQMIISIPALFIVLTNMVFPKLCRMFHARTLALGGLVLYTFGGCAAGLFSNIYLVLVFRALVGVGVGIIMPMSTGLISFYYTRDKQDKLMGLSSAMNQMGGVIATLISGFLAGFSWRASFLVYLMGLSSMVLCVMFMPKEKIGGNDGKKQTGVFQKNYMFILAVFLSMFTFFVYPSVFAMETAKEGIVPMSLVAIIMAGMDVVAFFGGLSFVHIKGKFGMKTRFVAPVLFFVGYALMFFIGGWVGAIGGSVFIGFANGLSIPFLMGAASQRAGKAAAMTVMPLLSMALYLAQFVTPMVLSAITGIAGDIPHLSYGVAMVTAVLFMVWSFITIKEEETKHIVVQEK